jgi:hypothetical protein
MTDEGRPAITQACAKGLRRLKISLKTAFGAFRGHIYFNPSSTIG